MTALLALALLLLASSAEAGCVRKVVVAAGEVDGLTKIAVHALGCPTPPTVAVGIEAPDGTMVLATDAAFNTAEPTFHGKAWRAYTLYLPPASILEGDILTVDVGPESFAVMCGRGGDLLSCSLSWERDRPVKAKQGVGGPGGEGVPGPGAPGPGPGGNGNPGTPSGGGGGEGSDSGGDSGADSGTVGDSGDGGDGGDGGCSGGDGGGSGDGGDE